MDFPKIEYGWEAIRGVFLEFEVLLDFVFDRVFVGIGEAVERVEIFLDIRIGWLDTELIDGRFEGVFGLNCEFIGLEILSF